MQLLLLLTTTTMMVNFRYNYPGCILSRVYNCPKHTQIQFAKKNSPTQLSEKNSVSSEKNYDDLFLVIDSKFQNSTYFYYKKPDISRYFAKISVFFHTLRVSFSHQLQVTTTKFAQFTFLEIRFYSYCRNCNQLHVKI